MIFTFSKLLEKAALERYYNLEIIILLFFRVDWIRES